MVASSPQNIQHSTAFVEGIPPTTCNFRIIVNPTIAIHVASAGWPNLVGGQLAKATPITTGRLSDDPLWRVESAVGQFGLRGWASHRRGQADQAHRYLRHATNRFGLPLPLPHACCEGSHQLFEAGGLFWELAPWLSGEPVTGELNREQLKSSCKALAELHVATRELDVAESDDPVARFSNRLESLVEELSKNHLGNCALHEITSCWSKDWPDTSRALYAGATKALDPLQGCNRVVRSPQWIWGDAWHGNYLFAGDHVSALVDFGTVRIDTPLADVARLLGSATQCGSDAWESGLDAYARFRQLTIPERELVTVLHNGATVLSLANWIRWLCIEQRRLPDLRAARRRVDHFARRLAEYLGFSDEVG